MANKSAEEKGILLFFGFEKSGFFFAIIFSRLKLSLKTEIFTNLHKLNSVYLKN